MQKVDKEEEDEKDVIRLNPNRINHLSTFCIRIILIALLCATIYIRNLLIKYKKFHGVVSSACSCLSFV